MKKISSGFTFFNKKVFPVIWFGFLLLFVTVAITSGALQKDPMFLIVPLFMFGIGYLVMKMLVFDLMDEVFDCGSYLLVKNRDMQDHVYLADVMNISITTYMNPPRITLRLRKPSRFGTEISFSPITGFRLNPFARNPIAEDLILRVDKERLKAAG